VGVELETDDVDNDTNAEEAWQRLFLSRHLEKTEDANVQASYSSALLEGGVFTITIEEIK
jgi:hypothetical protein